MKNIKLSDLTNSQKEAFNGLSKFIESPITKDINSRVAVLVGKAGTGKTTLIRLILDKYLESDRQFDRDEEFSSDTKYGASSMSFNFASPKVHGVALAHKAKNVLANSIHFVNTFAGYFGLKEQYDESGKLKFIRDDYKMSRSNCKKPHKVAVHDECSMYDAEMLATVTEETYHSAKIIFMGDSSQISPISSEGDDDSPVFSYFKNRFYLEERIRQTKGNPIVDLSDIIHEQIFREIKSNEVDDRIKIVLSAISKENIVDGKGFTHLKYKDFLEDYRKSSVDYLDSKVIAYRNAKVLDFNRQIRNYLYKNPTVPFIEGEIIYMNDTYYSDKDDTDKKSKWVCYNSDEYKISGVTKGSLIEEVDCNLLYIDKTGHKHLQGVENPYIPIVSPLGKKQFTLTANWRKSQVFKAEPYKRGQKWKFYYDFANLFGNISYGYCYTAHKSQGSTFRIVYVDINDILMIGPISTKRKLQAIYTAVTRASHLVKFLKSN